jgi:hypothetical protein
VGSYEDKTNNIKKKGKICDQKFQAGDEDIPTASE